MYKRYNTINSNNREVKMEWNSTTKSTKDPDVWGPAAWFTIHNFAFNYPDNPSPIFRKKCAQFIDSLPYMIPCEGCSGHAIQYVMSRESEMDVIVATRSNLFEFFVDFHNEVNKRYNKPVMSVKDAYKLYETGNVKYLTYK